MNFAFHASLARPFLCLVILIYTVVSSSFLPRLCGRNQVEIVQHLIVSIYLRYVYSIWSLIEIVYVSFAWSVKNKFMERIENVTSIIKYKILFTFLFEKDVQEKM